MKRIRVSADVQNQLEGIFIQQEQAFYDGVNEEVAFDGGWKPEPNELLYAPVTAEAIAVLEAAQGNVIAMPEINPTAFSEENIRGLGVLVQRAGGPRLLMQGFSAAQILERRFSLVLDGNTFNRLTQPAFSIGASLVGVIENARIKFNNFTRIKQIFDLTNLYQEATSLELDAFCDLPSLQIANVAEFKRIADQRMRKLVHAIAGRGTLNQYTPQQIEAAGNSEGFPIAVVDNRIVMPTGKAEAKDLLHFLDYGLYRAALSGEIYITNSKRLRAPAVG
nr:hypothetical protein RAR13_20250 [Aminobacter aminovorans]